MIKKQVSASCLSVCARVFFFMPRHFLHMGPGRSVSGMCMSDVVGTKCGQSIKVWGQNDENEVVKFPLSFISKTFTYQINILTRFTRFIYTSAHSVTSTL